MGRFRGRSPPAPPRRLREGARVQPARSTRRRRGQSARGGAGPARGWRRDKMVSPGSLRVVRCGGGGQRGARAVFSADSKQVARGPGLPRSGGAPELRAGLCPLVSPRPAAAAGRPGLLGRGNGVSPPQVPAVRLGGLRQGAQREHRGDPAAPVRPCRPGYRHPAQPTQPHAGLRGKIQLGVGGLPLTPVCHRRGCPGAGWGLGRGWEWLGHRGGDVSLKSDKSGRAMSVSYKHKREMSCGLHYLNGMTNGNIAKFLIEME